MSKKLVFGIVAYSLSSIVAYVYYFTWCILNNYPW